MKLLIQNLDNIEIPKGVENKLKIAVEEVLTQEAVNKNFEISLSFVNNKEIKALNLEFRGIDKATDVLSFPLYEEFNIEGDNMLGDIIISVEKAEEQALEYGHSIEREIIYLAVHSMLHLLGYDHMTDEEKEEMRSKEKSVMRALDLFK